MGLVLLSGCKALHNFSDSFRPELVFSSRSVVEVGAVDTSVTENSTLPSRSAWEEW